MRRISVTEDSERNTENPLTYGENIPTVLSDIGKLTYATAKL